MPAQVFIHIAPTRRKLPRHVARIHQANRRFKRRVRKSDGCNRNFARNLQPVLQKQPRLSKSERDRPRRAHAMPICPARFAVQTGRNVHGDHRRGALVHPIDPRRRKRRPARAKARRSEQRVDPRGRLCRNGVHDWNARILRAAQVFKRIRRAQRLWNHDLRFHTRPSKSARRRNSVSAVSAAAADENHLSARRNRFANHIRQRFRRALHCIDRFYACRFKISRLTRAHILRQNQSCAIRIAPFVPL